MKQSKKRIRVTVLGWMVRNNFRPEECLKMLTELGYRVDGHKIRK